MVNGTISGNVCTNGTNGITNGTIGGNDGTNGITNGNLSWFGCVNVHLHT